MGRNGVYHIFGIIKFAAYKWLNKIKSRKDKQNKIQPLPSTYTHSMARNKMFSITNKDHFTQQSKELIASLQIYWTNLYCVLKIKARTTNYQNISLKDYLCWGKTVIHSTINSIHTFEKIRN